MMPPNSEKSFLKNKYQREYRARRYANPEDRALENTYQRKWRAKRRKNPVLRKLDNERKRERCRLWAARWREKTKRNNPCAWATHLNTRKERARKIHRKDPRILMLEKAKIRARLYGLSFKITKEDLLIPKKCPVLGIAIKIGAGKPIAGSPTIDKFFPSRGYVPGNVTVISHRANTLKRDATPREIEKLYNWIQLRKIFGDNAT